MPIKDYFKPTDVDKSIVIASTDSKRREVIKSIEEETQSGGGGVSKRK